MELDAITDKTYVHALWYCELQYPVLGAGNMMVTLQRDMDEPYVAIVRVRVYANKRAMGVDDNRRWYAVQLPPHEPKQLEELVHKRMQNTQDRSGKVTFVPIEGNGSVLVAKLAAYGEPFHVQMKGVGSAQGR